MATRPAIVDLVQAAREGDDSAFEALFGPILEPAYRLAAVMLHDRNLAEDVVQESALKAWRKLGQLRRQSAVRPWFLSIVANECRSAARLRRRTIGRDTSVEPVSTGPEDSAIAGMQLRAAVKGMDADKRLIVTLRWYLDVPIAEIAAITNLSVHAAESRLTRATRELRSRLEGDRGRT